MRTPFIAIPLALLTVAAGCEKKNNSQLTQQLEHFADSINAGHPNNGGAAKAGDPCSLLDTTEVAGAIGPLAAPPYRGSWKPERGSASCRYDTKDHRRMVLSVDWTDGPIAMRMVRFGRGLTDGVTKAGEMKTGKIVLSSGDTLEGDWDEVAQGPMSCCDLHALRGDQHIEMDWAGTRMKPTAAGALLNSAVKRLDHPLAIDGSAGIPAGEQLYAADAKDSALNMCALIPQVVVEAIIGAKLTGSPQPGSGAGGRGSRQCTYHAPTPGGNLQREFELDLSEWHDGAVQFVQDQYATGSGTRAISMQARGDTTSFRVDTSAYPVGPWDVAGPTTNMGFEAVEGPYLVKAIAFGDRTAVLDLLAKATTALAAPH